MTILLGPDDERESGLTVCDVIQRITVAEAEAGNLQGRQISTEDDSDNGTIEPVAFRSIDERSVALNKARALKRLMVDKYGVPEVSIELVAGRPNSYGVWDALFVVGDMSHHTVSRYSPTALTPVLALCKNGRSDLAGPLCNGYGGWDLCYRIITFGYANHPGTGGPISVPALNVGKFVIPRDSGRRYLWGTEWEGGLNGSDWDRILTNPRNGKRMTMREFMGRSNAALEEFHKIHYQAHLEHSTWTSRKIDRLHYTASKGIQEKQPYRNSTGDWLAMADKDDVRQVVREELSRIGHTVDIVIDTKGKGPEDDVKWPLNRVFRALLNDEARIKAALKNHHDTLVHELTAAIVALIPEPSPAAPEGITHEEIVAAVEAGVRNVLGGLDE